MKTTLDHILVNVSAKRSIVFYKEFLAYLGYKLVDESNDYVGMSNETTDVWIVKTEGKYKSRTFHRKNTGLNHLAFRVDTKRKVDSFCKEFLATRKLPILYKTPKLFPEYGDGYYAVYFEDPDRIKLEVVSYPKSSKK